MKYSNRLKALKNKIIGSAFFTANPTDIFYLTGCTGSNNFLLTVEDKVVLFTDGRYLTQINTQKKVDLEIVELSSKTPLEKAILQEIKGISSLRFHGENLNFLVGKKIMDALQPLPFIEDYSIIDLRSSKDEEELEIIQRNIDLTAQAYQHIKSLIKEGITEIEAAAELEYFCRSHGASSMSFVTIVLAGEHSAMPHGKPSIRAIHKNDIIQFDFGIVKDSYCSDFSRVFCLGSPHPQVKKAHLLIIQAIEAVIEKSRCGMTGQEIDEIARSVIRKGGFEREFCHGLGHGIGLSTHENPMLNSSNSAPILENSVFTIEPGIYMPNIGGVRLEDVAVMRSSGFELLTNCSYDYH